MMNLLTSSLLKVDLLPSLKKLRKRKKNADNRQNLADDILENEKLKYQTTIRDQENRIRDLEKKLKKFELLKNYEWLIRLAISVEAAIFTWWFSRNG